MTLNIDRELLAEPATGAGERHAAISAVVLVDSDSYAKWGVSVLAAMPAGWRKRIVLVNTAVQPSSAQIASAVAGSGFAASEVDTTSAAQAIASLRDSRPDVVIVSMLGPAAAIILRELQSGAHDRPVLVTGLPGISIPATSKAILRRLQADLFLLHSKREVRAFRELAAGLGVEQRFALATLPFLAGTTRQEHGGRDIVFAAQAIVPSSRDDRTRLLGWLETLARRHPDHRVIIKLRAVSGEQQTHAEADSYEELYAELPDRPANLVVASGPMSEFLADAAALVTVSSTAAIEAVALGVPVLAIDEFGVGPELINEVFVGSGLLAGADALEDARFERASEAWLDDNYLHPADDNDWLAHLDELLRVRSLGRLPDRAPFDLRRGGVLRRAWDRRLEFGPGERTLVSAIAVAIGVPATAVLRVARRVRRAMAPAVLLSDDVATGKG